MGPLESTQANVTGGATARTDAGGGSPLGPGSRAAVQAKRRRPARVRKLDLAIILILVILLALSATPWPSAMLIRSVFERGAQSTIDEMEPYVPDTPLQEHAGVVYKPGSSFDVFSPAGTAVALPTIVWIHGGAWISGAQRDVEPYLRILAAEGYTTIGVSYPIAPEAVYPTAVRDINDALGGLTDFSEPYQSSWDRKSPLFRRVQRGATA